MTDRYYAAEIEGYASIFNSADDNGDVIAPGAFTQTISGRADGPVRMLYQHDAAQPIGRWLSLREDARGLFIRGELLLNSDRAREVYALLEGGAIDGLSIGFQTVTASKTASGRRITRAALWEVSVVTFPMAKAARILKVGKPKPARRQDTLSPESLVQGHLAQDHLAQDHFAESLRSARAILAPAA